ncbi:MAG TPA: class I SAM-dependent methyltransferase [Verrucomicrobiae bacterium]|nr:class I SAM-dependent methyltransferase [Verrucomicrobiae bacterium]
MITRSDNYVEYCRQTAKHARDVHDLALRGRDQQEVTKVIHQHIVEAVELRPEDDLVDVGCGDGILLRMAGEIGVHSAVGFLATEEEVAVVRRAGLDVRQALSDHLPAADASASVVVCNCVLPVVPREKIPATLHEISRIAKPHARIFLGEVSVAEEPDPTPRFKSRREMLSFLLHNRGLRAWFGMLRRMIWWQITAKPAVILPGTGISFFAAPDEFVAMAGAVGMEILRYWESDYPTRNNYLFRKSA